MTAITLTQTGITTAATTGHKIDVSIGSVIGKSLNIKIFVNRMITATSVVQDLVLTTSASMHSNKRSKAL